MRIIALLSWYDERAAWLAATVASVAPFADHVVAVDGAYELYPGGRPHSPAEQAEAIRETARAVAIGCTIIEPQAVWAGNEVEKRSVLFAGGEIVSESADWYFVIDGDALITEIGCDVKRRCVDTPCDAGEVTMWEYRSQQRIRCMFRAIRGLRVEGNHYTYVTPDGRYLWGDGRIGLEPPADFTPIRMQHRNREREPQRAKGAKLYYQRRDELNIEGLRVHHPANQGA